MMQSVTFHWRGKERTLSVGDRVYTAYADDYTVVYEFYVTRLSSGIPFDDAQALLAATPDAADGKWVPVRTLVHAYYPTEVMAAEGAAVKTAVEALEYIENAARALRKYLCVKDNIDLAK